jgi:hypothetical protein
MKINIYICISYMKFKIMTRWSFINAADTVICEGWHFTVSQRCWHSYMWRLTFYCITALLIQLYVKVDILLYHSAADSYMWRLTFYCITALLTQLYVKVDILLYHSAAESYIWGLTFYCITALLTQLYVKVDILLYHKYTSSKII